ncbi:hypothetical protein ACROSR_18540 [Roseovarius tibetensis]|uniref:hypothetical protein n=1 Tax=Roseovarius tibetensis TaxID=2685897 RepID=UPI003D7F6E11
MESMSRRWFVPGLVRCRYAHMLRENGDMSMTAIIEREHGRFRIKAGRLGGDFKARAFRKPPTKKMRLIAETAADSPEEAIDALIRKLDEADQASLAARRVDPVCDVKVPLRAEFDEALEHLDFSDSEAWMLIRHAHAADVGCTRSELAGLLGEVEVGAVEKFYMRLCRSILHFIAPVTAIVNGKEIPVDTPVFLWRVEPDPEPRDERLCLHPEFREALMDHVAWERRASLQGAIA